MSAHRLVGILGALSILIGIGFPTVTQAQTMPNGKSHSTSVSSNQSDRGKKHYPQKLGLDSGAAKLKNRYIVRTRSNAGVSKVLSTGGVKKVSVLQTFNAGIHGFLADLSTDQIKNLRHDPNVLSVEKDKRAHIFGTQEASYDKWQLDRLDTNRRNDSYTFNKTGSGVDVFIVDTGVRTDHSEFVGRITRGYNAITNQTSAGSYDDCNGHGTHVAGLAAGTTYGVAKRANIIPVKVLDCNGYGSVSDIIDGLTWIKNNVVAGRPSVVNMSLGTEADVGLDAAVADLISAGITVVAAAGNSRENSCSGTTAVSPARNSSVITVGGLERSTYYDYATNTDTDNDQLWWGSSYGSCVDLYAPSTSIKSAWNSGFQAFEVITGTSMASPLASGVAALYLQGTSGKTPAQVETALINASTKDIIDTRSYPPTDLSNFKNRALTVVSPPGSNEPGDTKELATPVSEFSFSTFDVATPTVNGLTSIDLDTAGATFTAGDPVTGNSDPTVWLKFVAPVSGSLTISKDGTANKGQLQEQDNSGNLSNIGSYSNLPITRDVQSGKQYYLLLSVPVTSSFTLNFSLDSSGTAPSNTAKTTSSPITYSLPSTATGFSTPALGREYTENNYNMVWHKFTTSSGSARWVTFDSEGSSYDTNLSLFDTNGVLLTQNENHGGASWSKLSFQLQASTQYFVAVGSQHYSDYGDFVLNIKEATPPSNNNVTSATNVSTVPVTLTGSNVNADSEALEENHLTGYSSNGGGCSSARPMCAYRIPNDVTSGSSVWWKYSASVSGKITVDTAGSNFNTVIAVYRVLDETDYSNRVLQESKFDDCKTNVSCTPASVVMSVRKNSTYLIVVAGYADYGSVPSEGSIVLNLSSRTNLSPPLNDSLAQATSINVSSVGTVASGTVVDATGDDGFGSIQGVWYKFTAPTTGVIEFSISGANDLLVTGYVKKNANLIRRNSSEYFTQLSVKSGDEYFIEVSASYGLSSSTFSLTIETITVRNPIVNDIPELASSLNVQNSGSLTIPADSNLVRGTGPLNGNWRPSRFWTFTPSVSGTITFAAPGSFQFGVYSEVDGLYTPIAVSVSLYDEVPFAPITATVAAGTVYSLVIQGEIQVDLTWTAITPSAPANPPQQVQSTPVATPTPVAAPVVVSKPTILPSSAGTAVTISSTPSSKVATEAAVGVNGNKITIALSVPTSASKTAQVVKYTITLKPSKGKVLTKTVSAKAGKTVAPALNGVKGTTYKVQVTAITKAGKKIKWNGPSVTTG